MEASAEANRQLASWLLANRLVIESRMAAGLGPATPAASSPESEALRRFRSFLCSALVRGDVPTPALDGLRLNERRVMALLDAWSQAACEAGPEPLGPAIGPLIDHFRLAIRTSHGGRSKGGRPRATRRAVAAAIDRVADAFLAIDTDSGEIVDANPAAGSLLGVKRDALLGVEALSFVDRGQHDIWWTQLDAMTEGDEARTFGASLHDVAGAPLDVEATATRFATKGRVLALLMMRPRANGAVPG